tara:strand:+ start:560 stop:916 length:357 start_codon:yes stop_codon:yes gene_type:complete
MSEAKFKQNVQNSFARTKSDMYNLYEHIQFLYREIEELKFRNDMMAQKLSILRDSVSIEKKVPYTERKDIFVSSRSSSKVHKESCAFAKNIKAVNKIRFESESEALQKGYKKCACLST